MLGPPAFPDTLPPDWDEFCEDYSEKYFDLAEWTTQGCFIIEVGGETVGQVNFDRDHLPEGFAELDIWMRSAADCGRGWGSDALIAMTGWLHERLGLDAFLIRPSRRNPAAIRAYRKAGFLEVEMNEEEQARRFGAGDYPDTVVLIKRIDSGPS